MSIFVGNLPFRAEKEDVIQLFAPFGEVMNCSLPLERDTGRKRGFAFIEMEDETIENSAIEGLQGAELMGRPLRINKAEPRSNSPRRNNNYDNKRSGGNSEGGYGGRYGSSNTNSGYGGRYGSSNTNSGYGSSYGGNSSSFDYDQGIDNKSKVSGAKDWEDRSYGNTVDADFENGRSRRKRGTSNETSNEGDS